MAEKGIIMAKKEATATTQEVKKKAERVSVKDKARKHISRLATKAVIPMVFEEVLTAYAVIGILKYDEVLEMSDSYAATYIVVNCTEQKGE